MNKRYYYYYKGKVIALGQTKEQEQLNVFNDVDDVIGWFLTRGTMSPKKLQKLLYYAYAWTLTLENEDVEILENKLFDSRIEAWVHGPVIPEVYHKYRPYGFQNIEQRTGESPVFDDDIESILNQVWDVYGSFTGDELEALTHQEMPWENARKGYKPLDRCNEIIDDRDIFICYGERL